MTKLNSYSTTFPVSPSQLAACSQKIHGPVLPKVGSAHTPMYLVHDRYAPGPGAHQVRTRYMTGTLILEI